MTAIKLTNISKTFPVFKSPFHQLITLFNPRKLSSIYSFKALDSINIDIKKGEFFGVIGMNGSGKSTLLQLICGILEPSTGSIHVDGKIGALLELGAGFNPEFTGRENARLNANILGVSNSEFKKLLPDIIDFADIGEFIDRPVKTYSSGMYVRLAFAVQACIKPDILIVDEALAVGDIFFRLKCYEYIDQLIKDGCAVILVTHSMEDIMNYCDRALLLENGRATFIGSATQAVNYYYAGGENRKQEKLVKGKLIPENTSQSIDIVEKMNFFWPDIKFNEVEVNCQTTNDKVICLNLAVTDSDCAPKNIFYQSETLSVFAEFIALEDIYNVVSGVILRLDKGVIVHGKHGLQGQNNVIPLIKKNTKIYCRHDIKLDVGCNEYVIDISIAGWSDDVYLLREHATLSEMESSASRHCVVNSAVSISVVAKPGKGFESQPFYGLTNLESVNHIYV